MLITARSIAERCRPRARPNRDLSAAEYKEILDGWIADENITRFSLTLGPLAKSKNSVTVTGLLKSLPLAKRIIQSGSNECVAHGHRLEAALGNVLTNNPDLAVGLGKYAANDIANHCQHCFSVLRDLVREDQQMDCGKLLRPKKTGKLRRQFRGTDWLAIQSLDISLPQSRESSVCSTVGYTSDGEPTSAVVAVA